MSTSLSSLIRISCCGVYFLSCFIWPRIPAACGILVLQPGIEPMGPALETQSLNHWIIREVPGYILEFRIFKI